MRTGACLAPAGGFENGELARLSGGRNTNRPTESVIAGVAADPGGDGARDGPRVLGRGSQNAKTALAQMIIGAAAIEPAEAGLESDAAAVAPRPQGRADDLRAECGRKNARPDGASRSAARTACG